MTGRFERPRHIRFAHCDPAGIVFYPQYLVMMNGLVEDWFSDGLGIAYPELIGRRRIGLPTVRLDCEFKAVSRMGDDVVLGLEVDAIGSRSLTLRLDCAAGSETRVRIHNVLVTTHLDTHRAIALPEDLRAAVERFRAGG
jgi:4-hydroxybenzoyl-CoA thioesterase